MPSFTEAAKEAAGYAESPTGSDEVLDAAGIAPEETTSLGEDPYAAAADSWAAGQGPGVELTDDDAAARRLYDLALEFQERSQRNEARILDEFEVAATGASGLVGDLVIVDDDDERLVLTASGEFRAEVVPEEAAGEWRTLSGPDQLVEFYDPTDVFGDLADALAEAFPAVAPDFVADAAAADGDADTTDDDDGTDDDDDGTETTTAPATMPRARDDAASPDGADDATETGAGDRPTA